MIISLSAIWEFFCISRFKFYNITYITQKICTPILYCKNEYGSVEALSVCPSRKQNPLIRFVDGRDAENYTFTFRQKFVPIYQVSCIVTDTCARWQ
jgi:hypothetical protein